MSRRNLWWLAVLAAALTVPTGAVPVQRALSLGQRLAPVLLFVVAATVLAELADQAGVFQVAADRAARLAGGRTAVLFALVVVLASVTTIVLSLDTTAVLLTPVVLTLARRLQLDPWPFACATVLLANTASLLLPGSNLTNLLAADRLGLTVLQTARLTAAPAAVAVAVTVGALAWWDRKALRGRYVLPVRQAHPDRVLLTAVALVCAAVVPAVLAGLAVAAVFTAAAVLAAGATMLRGGVRWRATMVPWRLLLGVCALFLVVSAAGPLGLDHLLTLLAGSGSTARTVATAAVGANVANNLPAYLALERVAPHQLLAVLVGVDVGPLISPWASLATLLWAQRCSAGGVTVPWRRLVLRGAVLTPVLLTATALALPR